ncbi:MAG: hypothetical protein ACE5D1_06250 [Fidelibacterota bacterium]
MSFSPQRLTQLLLQEREYFRTILEETESVYRSLDSVTTDALLELFKKREGWIRKIKILEKVRRAHTGKLDKTQAQLREEVMELSRTIISIDARLKDIIHRKKMENIQELSRLADIKNRRMNKQVFHKLKKARYIDIHQE